MIILCCVPAARAFLSNHKFQLRPQTFTVGSIGGKVIGVDKEHSNINISVACLLSGWPDF